MTEWNPRFVAYARSHGLQPEKMLIVDKERWSGGKMSGFIVWISERWSQWRSLNGRKLNDILSKEDHRDFDLFLQNSLEQAELTGR